MSPSDPVNDEVQMAKGNPFKKAVLNSFEAQYDASHEDLALQSRGAFLKAFPLRRLGDLTVDTYVIGLQSPTFCSYVEAKTRYWAAIQGSPAFKFGIYFGRTKSVSSKQYHWTHKFGTSAAEAFAAVKAALLDLVREGARRTPDYAAIDRNPLSQMFKAKILSLYFPERFLALCSAEHLEVIGGELGFPDDLNRSAIQSGLLDVKADNAVISAWSNPKFMRFLVDTYIPKKHKPPETARALRRKVHRKVNFEDIQNQRGIIGKRAEEFALKWEKNRLIGADLEHLIENIKDRRERPGYGYDFLSHSAVRQARFIEVKAVSKQGGQYRFFLSENEYTVSRSPEYRGAYYFYLVLFDGERQPVELRPRLAARLYTSAEIAPATYTVLVDLDESSDEDS
jgi:hypothetical protein